MVSGRKLDRIQQELDEFKRKNWIEEHPNAKKQYNIAVLGLGMQGSSSALEISKIQSPEWLPIVKSVYLVSENLTKMKFESSKIGVVCDEHHVDVKPIIRNNLEDYINEFDICVITADQSSFAMDRSKRIIDNAPMVIDLASKFKKDYKGNVIIVTNLTDVMAHIFSMYSEVDPRRIIGMNHLDTKRLRFILQKYIDHVYKDKMDCSPDISRVYAIGHHNDPYPILSNIRISGKEIPAQRSFPQGNQDEVRSEFKLFVDKYSGQKKEITGEKKGFSIEESDEAIVQTIKAIMYQEQGKIVASTIHPAEGVFIGLPVDVLSDVERIPFFRINTGFLDSITDKDTAEFNKRIVYLKDTIKGLQNSGLIKKEPLVFPTTQFTLEGAVKKEENLLILGAGGRSNKIFAWDMLGELKHEIKVEIGGVEKFASCVKAFKYDDEDYVAIGTSSGVLIKSLKDTEFKRELLLTNPDGRTGHVRSIEIIGDSLFCSNYHLIMENNTGKGLFRIDLDAALDKKKSDLSNVVSGVTGPITKIKEGTREVILFSYEDSIFKYHPDSRSTEPFYKAESAITAISPDGMVFGDTKGNVYLQDASLRAGDIKKKKINLNGAAITALEHINHEGEHVIVGDELSYVVHCRLESGNLVEKISFYAGKMDPLSLDTTSDKIMSVDDIKYFDMNGRGKIFIACGPDISSIRLKDLISKQLDNLDKSWNKDKERSIYSLSVFRGGV